MSNHHENGGDQDRPGSDFLEEFDFEEAGIDLEGRVDKLISEDMSAYDEAYTQLYKACCGLNLMEQIILLDNATGQRFARQIDIEKYAQDLIIEVGTGIEILEYVEQNPGLKKDLSGLPPEMIEDARGLAYVARQHGIEVSLPDSAIGSNNA